MKSWDLDGIIPIVAICAFVVLCGLAVFAPPETVTATPCSCCSEQERLP